MSPTSKRERIFTGLVATGFACASFVALSVMGTHAGATEHRNQTVESTTSRTPGEPILAIVSLRSQQITVYDAKGLILRSRVSSGQRGRETPAGIFSIIQKDAEHYSNIYDDAYMPNMERLTWSGIALHGGVVPGYPASHGCVRMPYEFAKHLFDLTQIGLRTIVSPTDVVPAEIAHPILSLSKPNDSALAATRVAQADEAVAKADQARRAAGAAFREATQAMAPVRIAENLKLRANMQLAAAETALASPLTAEAKDQAERSKSETVARIAELDAQLESAKANLQPKIDALNSARQAALSAQSAQATTAQAARQAAHELAPISVLISRKTQRLYIRQDLEPTFESPVTIQDADRPIGTHIFTAMERSNGGGMRWSVVSLNTGHASGAGARRQSRPDNVQGADLKPGDQDDAKSALDRIVIPQEALQRISWMAPRSSLIITDEALSTETGKGTDFVVLLSGEPQGGIKMRRRAPPETDAYYTPRERMPNWRPRFANPFSTW
jgi:hypothetical protein